LFSLFSDCLSPQPVCCSWMCQNLRVNRAAHQPRPPGSFFFCLCTWQRASASNTHKPASDHQAAVPAQIAPALLRHQNTIAPPPLRLEKTPPCSPRGKSSQSASKCRSWMRLTRLFFQRAHNEQASARRQTTHWLPPSRSPYIGLPLKSCVAKRHCQRSDLRDTWQPKSMCQTITWTRLK